MGTDNVDGAAGDVNNDGNEDDDDESVDVVEGDEMNTMSDFAVEQDWDESPTGAADRHLSVICCESSFTGRMETLVD